MPFVPATNTIEVEMRYEQDDQQMENTLYFSLNTAWSVPTMQTHGEEMIAWWAILMAPWVHQNVVLRECYITDLTTISSPALSVVPLLLTQGADNGNPLPNNVTLCTSFRTTSRGRSYRGRNYSVGASDNFVDQNTFQPTYLAGVIAAYNDLMPGGSLTRGVWSVVSRFSGVDPTTHAPIPRVAAVVTPITTVVIVDDTADSQRRRLPGRGR
jgi:hypothetical protein